MKGLETINEVNPRDHLALAADLKQQVSADTSVLCDEALSRRTTMRVGGPADLFVQPADESDLAAVLRWCAERGQPWFVLGRGSNLIVRDGGIRGVVITLAHPNFSAVEAKDDRIRAGAGAKLKHVSVAAKRAGLGGLEFLEGIPGSVGGALRMNAGAMGSETFGAIESVRVMDRSGVARDLATGAIAVEYRSCSLLKTHIAVGAVFKTVPATLEAILARLEAFNRKRWDTQPAAPSAGCCFKNPPGLSAGQLVEQLGLKGKKVGGAMVSFEHGNFITNDGSARARDVLELMEFIRAEARQRRGIELHPEWEIVGED
jgi:UDP-N-acetylenolpyruvoylglucosamine reductase